ncbi:MAG TPA: thiosulfate oxidation carrier protein SoxY [Methylovirgula sp.]|jgi:sulfur-oxidizing protein SoxY|nr:thiosulfate oxidation carrier protein SoxY [Methylovirgula sp.]
MEGPSQFKMPSATRRGALAMLALAGLTGFAGKVWAAVAPGWPENAFKQKSKDDAVKALYGKPMTASDKITLEVPEIAENGAVVPVTVSTTLPNVTSISILVEQNPYTVAASYKLSDATLPSVGCRLKMAKTTAVIGVVESGGNLYSTSKQVKVTLGGCGG